MSLPDDRDRLCDLAGRFLEQDLGGEELHELEIRLAGSEEARRTYLSLCLVHEELAGLLDAGARQREAAARPAPPRILSRRRWLAVAAAALAAAGAAWLLLRTESHPQPDYTLQADGRVLGRGAAVVARDAEVRLDLGGYCRVRAARGSAFRVEGTERAEQIFLERGRVTCAVNRNVGTFAVRSAAGTASVKGTRFEARLENAGPASNPADTMLVVTVEEGSVLVSGPAGGKLVPAGEAWAVSRRRSSPPDSPPAQPEGTSPDLLRELKTILHRIVYASTRDGNGEIYRMRADGSDPANLTRTPDVDEFTPRVSPDGTRIAFVADAGLAGARRRSVCVMNLDGTERRTVAKNGRDPCWSPDGRTLAYLGEEFERPSPVDFATRGIFLHDFRTGRTRPHPRRDIQHLHTLRWSPDGRWFVATVHGGMGFGHAIAALAADGERLVDLGLRCCRPDLSPDGTRIAWGQVYNAVGVADLDLSGPEPRVSRIRNVVGGRYPLEIVHIAWCPDGRYIAYSYGPKTDEKRATDRFPEYPGVAAPGWNIGIVDTTQKNRWAALTLDGASCKEPAWVPVRDGSKR
jgi:Tol biopolymer transport system component/ferric-dicitrate binding protein FerR (iron transport regulator)